MKKNERNPMFSRGILNPEVSSYRMSRADCTLVFVNTNAFRMRRARI